MNNAVLLAGKCYNILLQEGELLGSKYAEEYAAFLNEPGVREYVESMANEPPISCRVLHVPKSGCVYLIPGSDSALLMNRKSYKNRYLKNAKTSVETYLDLILVLLILYTFYGSHNAQIKQREFLTYAEIVEIMEMQCDAVLKDEETMHEADDTSIAFTNVAINWKSMDLGEEEFTRDKGKFRRQTKAGAVLCVISHMVAEGLFTDHREEREIRTTRRLDDLMDAYYLKAENVKTLHKWLDAIRTTDKEETHAENQ